MVDSDDNRPLLHDRTPGPEVFSLSDDQVGARTRPGCERGHTVSLVSCDAARTWPRQQSAPIPIGNRFAELAQEEILEPGREIHVSDVSETRRHVVKSTTKQEVEVGVAPDSS